MPAAILVDGTGVPEEVLLAQLVSDASRRIVETVEAADDFRPASRVIGDLTQCVGIHALTWAPRPRRRSAPAGRVTWPLTTTARERKRKVGGKLRWRLNHTRRVFGGAVDAERVDEDLALADPLPQRIHADRTVRIVAIGNDEQRLLPVAPFLGRRERRSDGVIERSSADGDDLLQRITNQLSIRRPALGNLRASRELHKEQIVVFVQQLEDQSFDRRAGSRKLLGRHAAARIER